MRNPGNPAASVGRSIPRLEAYAKVTGRAEYVHNLRVPGMLVAKVFRSTVAHGRIRAIDVAAARAMPGVFAPLRRSRRSFRSRTTARRFTISLFLHSTKYVTWVNPWPWCWQPMRMWPRLPRS